MTNEHTSLEKYTSHTLFEMVAKGLCVRGELETEQNCNILTPSSSDYSSTSFLILLGYSTGSSEGPAFCWELVLTALNSNKLTPTYNWPQLTQLSVAPGYIIVWRTPASCGVEIAPNSIHPRSRWYPDIFDRMHLLFTRVHLLFVSST